MKPTSSENSNRNGAVSELLPVFIFSFILCYIMYGIVIHELPGELTDYNGHVRNYLATFTGGDPAKAWMMSPYFLWHTVALSFRYILRLPIESAAAASSCLFLLLSYLITVSMIDRWNSYYSLGIRTGLNAFVSFILTIAQPIYISFLDAGVSRTVGTFTFNPLYNPTHMAARPFALICFMLVADLRDLQSDRTPVFFAFSVKKTLILLSVTLFVSATAKPVFAEMFIPAVGICMLVKQFSLIPEKNGSAKKFFTGSLIPTFIAAIPTIIYILLIYVLYVSFGGSYVESEGVFITKYLQVWSDFSENIPLSILFMMSFPIFVLVVDAKNYLKTTVSRIGIVSFIIGFLECAFLGEGGVKLYHGNFVWPMLFGILLFWASALLHFLSMDKKASTGLTRFLVMCGWILLLVHLYYGLMYVFDVLDWDFMIF